MDGRSRADYLIELLGNNGIRMFHTFVECKKGIGGDGISKSLCQLARYCHAVDNGSSGLWYTRKRNKDLILRV